MHQLKEVLRLTAAGLSQRQIARSLKLSNGVVAKYQAAGRRAGLSWPLPESLDDVALANQLCAKPAESAPVSAAHVVPDFASIHEQLKEKGVTRLLLWEEYRAAHPDESYGYSQFCFHYQQWQSHLKLVMRQTHRAGKSKTGKSLTLSAPNSKKHSLASGATECSRCAGIGAHVPAGILLTITGIRKP